MTESKLHLKPPGNWMNDPNGFIYYNGEYHLFFQYFPYEPMWATMHWGHAVSKDLITWEHKKIALYPSQYGDSNGCFSGSALEEDGKLYFYYTGVRYEEKTKEDIHHCTNDRFESSQMMITSKDGYRFDNFGDKKMIIPPVTDVAVGDRTHTRDPKVWKGKDGYYMILGSTLHQKQGELLFYKSLDLNHWDYVNCYRNTEENQGWMWECPDLFEVNEKHVLIYSPMGFLKDGFKEENHSICRIVSFEEDDCSLEMPNPYQFVDYGLDLYAPQSTLDKDGNRIMIAWMRMPKPVECEEPWIGMMCQPRITEVKNQHIYFKVHPDIEAAFNTPVPDPGHLDYSKPYQLKVSLEEGEKISVGGYVITRKEGCICTDRTEVFEGIEGCRMTFQTPELNVGCNLNIFAEPNLVEVFINDGEYVVSNVVYELKQEVLIPEGKEYLLKQM